MFYEGLRVYLYQKPAVNTARTLYVTEWEKQSAVHIALTSFPSLHTACSFDILRNLMSTTVSLSLYICGNL
jgi:hypothetical protein